MLYDVDLTWNFFSSSSVNVDAFKVIGQDNARQHVDKRSHRLWNILISARMTRMKLSVIVQRGCIACSMTAFIDQPTTDSCYRRPNWTCRIIETCRVPSVPSQTDCSDYPSRSWYLTVTYTGTYAVAAPRAISWYAFLRASARFCFSLRVTQSR